MQHFRLGFIAAFSALSLFAIQANIQADNQAWVEITPAQLTTDTDSYNSPIPGLDPHILKLGKKAYAHAVRDHKVKKKLLTIVDFTLSSDKRRLWVLSMKNPNNPTLIFQGVVSHASNSGGRIPTRFSNRNGSHMSSLGTFITANQPYFGAWGYSLRLHGQEPGINDNAYTRAIVFHSAWYDKPDFVQRNHAAGKTWGCFAINPNFIDYVANMIKGRSVLFAYAPTEARDPYLS